MKFLERGADEEGDEKGGQIKMAIRVAMINDRSRHGIFIDGRWRKSRAELKKYFVSRNPADTRRTLGFFPQSTSGEVDAAVRAAQTALSAWKKMPIPLRADYLRKMADILERRKEAIAMAVTQEIGKILTEARGDVQESIDVLRHMAGTARQSGIFGYTVPSEVAGKTITVNTEPKGVGAIISPWNFPTAIPFWNIAVALLCGNTLILKQSKEAPLCADIIAQVIAESELPPGVFNLVQGDRKVGEQIIRHPGINAISFTGSIEAGRRVKSIADEGNKPITLELGGKNATIVMPDADPSLALEGVLFGAFYTSGQRCTATSRLILLSRIADAFVEMIADAAKKIKVGDGLDEETFMGPVVSAFQLQKILGYIQTGKRQGAKLVYGGEALTRGIYRHGHFVLPTVFDHVDGRSAIAQEEIFGPVLSAIRVNSFEDAMAVYRGVAPGLSGAIYTRDLATAQRFVEEADTGLRNVNCPPSGAEVGGPFGGLKDTDLGTNTKESDVSAIRFWTSIFASNVVAGRVAMAQGVVSPLSKLGIDPSRIGDRF